MQPAMWKELARCIIFKDLLAEQNITNIRFAWFHGGCWPWSWSWWLLPTVWLIFVFYLPFVCHVRT